MREDQIVHAGVGRKFQNPSIYEDLTVFENLELSYPRGWTVFGALAFKRSAEVIACRRSCVPSAYALRCARGATRVEPHRDALSAARAGV